MRMSDLKEIINNGFKKPKKKKNIIQNRLLPSNTYDSNSDTFEAIAELVESVEY